jgi:ribosomal protein S18 acetylase RimI-like enzyme
MKSDIIKIRQARTTDLKILRAFEQEIISTERSFTPNLKDDPIEYYDLESLIKGEDSQVLVVTVNSVLIGSGYALIKKNIPYKKPGEYAYFGYMYVSPKFRGNGINGKIMEGLINWSKNKGLTLIQLDVYSENTNAINAYKKQGFEPDMLIMRLNIEK